MLSVALMAHPRRQAFIDELLPQLPGAELVLDRKNDRWDTGRRSLLAYDAAATHHLVVQDDAILCQDLVEGAAAAAVAAGDRPVGLYTGRVRPHQHTITPAVRKAVRAGRSWISAPGPYWGVAIVIPTIHIDELVDWCDHKCEIENYDRRIEAWYTQQEIECWYTVPSLVDHRPVRENPSLIRGRHGNHQAHVFIGCDRSALEIDWSTEPIKPKSGIAVFTHVRSGRETTAIEGGPRQRKLDRSLLWERKGADDHEHHAAA